MLKLLKEVPRFDIDFTCNCYGDLLHSGQYNFFILPIVAFLQLQAIL